jgi:predicted nucleotide-binding protein
MQNSRVFESTIFSVDVIQAAARQIESLTPREAKEKRDLWALSTKSGNSSWHYDSVDEFFADYRKRPKIAHFTRSLGYQHELKVDLFNEETEVSVAAPDRAQIESVFHIFESMASASKLPDAPEVPEKPTIFIGHGRDPQWKTLKDHLHEQHGYQVEAYETGARAGHAIRDILTELLEASSFALLVLTGEDEHADGTMHARENVIHEVGLFQGRLDYGRAIVLLEQGAQEFSNIAGVQQIRFSKGNIRETFGDVLATLRREFGSE